jgi:hypothetical protein
MGPILIRVGTNHPYGGIKVFPNKGDSLLQGEIIAKE